MGNFDLGMNYPYSHLEFHRANFMRCFINRNMIKAIEYIEEEMKIWETFAHLKFDRVMCSKYVNGLAYGAEAYLRQGNMAECNRYLSLLGLTYAKIGSTFSSHRNPVFCIAYNNIFGTAVRLKV